MRGDTRAGLDLDAGALFFDTQVVATGLSPAVEGRFESSFSRDETFVHVL